MPETLFKETSQHSPAASIKELRHACQDLEEAERLSVADHRAVRLAVEKVICEAFKACGMVRRA